MTPQTQHAGRACPIRQPQHRLAAPAAPSAHPAPPRARAHGRRLLLLAALTAVFTLLAAAPAFGITRDEVLARAQTWIDDPVPYSQTRYFGGYRTDCSGYASMCWATGTSYNTRTFYQVTSTIASDALKPGDALLKPNYHIRIFYGWVDAEHTRYLTYEQTGPNTKSSIKSIADDLDFGYKPTRYNKIVDGPPSDNALANGAFDSWASNGSGTGKAVWWLARPSRTPSGSLDATPVVQNRVGSKSGAFSLELRNPSARRTDYVTLEQTAAVTGGAPYELSAWARTAADPATLELRLRYLDASGTVLVDTRTVGAAWSVEATAWREMRIPVGSPANAAMAIVTAKLAGAPAADASSSPGASAVLDEISLGLPKAKITIATNTTASTIGRAPYLSGVVAPVEYVGTNIVVYVKKPLKGYWSYSSNRTVYSWYGEPRWMYKYYFKRGMTLGVYYYKAVAPALGKYLAATSSTISVRLR